MTPKEKARELVDKFARIDGYQDSIDLSKCEYEKQCALIAVDMLLESRVGYPYPHEVDATVENGIFNVINYPEKYWKEVKQEIEKLS